MNSSIEPKRAEKSVHMWKNKYVSFVGSLFFPPFFFLIDKLVQTKWNDEG